MAEKAEPAETLKPRLMRRIKNVRGYFWSVFPWPEQFYEREEDLEPIASDLMVSLTSIIIFILCGAAFGYTYVFFSDPSQDTVDRIVSAQTAIDGYTCRPMGPDKWYDLNWTHAECKKKLRPLTAENIDWPEPGDCSGVPCNCPRGEKIIYRPFGDYQRRNGIAPKSAEARTLTGTIDYPAAEALNGTCPEPQYSPMDRGGWPSDCRNVMAAKANVHDAEGVIMECTSGGVNYTKDWAVEHMKKVVAHFYTDLCDFTLSNVPYECIKMIPTDSMTMLALANNNAALVYTVAAIVFGLFLKALTKLRIDPGGNNPPRAVGPKVHWVRKLPLPASLFYDEPAELDFIDNDLVIGVSTFAVVSVAAACFAVFWGYYAGDEHAQLDVRFGSQWNVTGYNCTPMQYEEEWGTNMSYPKCLTSLRPIEADVSVIFEDNGEAKYVPFNSSTEGVSGVAWGKFAKPEFIAEANFCTKRDSFPQWDADANKYNFTGSNFDWESTEYEIGSGRIYLSEVCTCQWPNCPDSYNWTDANKTEAVEVWKKLVAMIGDEKLCDFTKTNAPFTCSKSEPMDLPTRFSLAYGNAMLIFASVCAVVAVLIRRRQKLCSCGKLKVADVKNSLRSTSVGKYISIPSNFYHEDAMELVAPPMATLFGFILWLAAFIASFVYLYQFYAAKTTVETTFISGTSKEGAICKPIRPHTYYQLDWNYDECMAKKERPSLANTRLIVSSTQCSRCGERAHVCNNKTEWGFRPWGADGPTFRYMKNESTSGLLTRLDNFTTEFNTKWNNDAGCNASSPVACTNTGSAEAHCPEVKLDDEDFMGLYKSHSSHRIWFQRYNGFGESFDYNATAFSEWGLFDKLGIIYDYLIESDELCKWTLENLPYSCEETVKMTTLEAVSLAFANAEFIGIGTGIVVGFLAKSIGKVLKKGDSKDAAMAGLGFTAAAVSTTVLG